MTATKTLQLLAQAKAAGKPLKRGRDSQRSKLYGAEQVLRKDPIRLTERQVNELVQKIRASAYVVRNYGDPGVIRVNITGRRYATSAAFWQSGEIRLAKGWGTQPDVVVHEMAHMYASPFGDPGHDWLFCLIYLDFVRKFLGKAEYDLLKASFKKNNIRHTPPRKRKTMSPAQKAAASDRMAKARAARAASSIEPHVFVMKAQRGLDYRYCVVKSFGNSPKVTSIVRDHLGNVRDDLLIRKTDSGVAKMLFKIRFWDSDSLAVPVSALEGLDLDNQRYLPADWNPHSLLRQASAS